MEETKDRCPFCGRLSDVCFGLSEMWKKGSADVHCYDRNGNKVGTIE